MAFSSIQKERPASSAMAARLSGHSAGNGWRPQASLAEIVLRWDWVDRETSLRLVFKCSQSLSTFATASLLKLLCSKAISETESQGSTANKRSRHWWHDASFTTLIDSSIGADLAMILWMHWCKSGFRTNPAFYGMLSSWKVDQALTNTCFILFASLDFALIALCEFGCHSTVITPDFDALLLKPPWFSEIRAFKSLASWIPSQVSVSKSPRLRRFEHNSMRQ